MAVRPGTNPALAKILYERRMAMAHAFEEEFEGKVFTSEGEDHYIQITGNNQIKDLGFRLESGEYLSQVERVRLATLINGILTDIHKVRDEASQKLIKGD